MAQAAVTYMKNLKKAHEEEKMAEISSVTLALSERVGDMSDKLEEAKMYVSAAKEYIESLKGVIGNLWEFIAMAEVDVNTASECIMESKRRINHLKSEMNCKSESPFNLKALIQKIKDSNRSLEKPMNRTLDKCISRDVLEIVRSHLRKSELDPDEEETLQYAKHDDVTVIVIRDKKLRSGEIELEANGFDIDARDSNKANVTLDCDVHFSNGTLDYDLDSLEKGYSPSNCKVNSLHEAPKILDTDVDSLDTAYRTPDYDLGLPNKPIDYELDSLEKGHGSLNSDKAQKMLDCESDSLNAVYRPLNSDSDSLNYALDRSDYLKMDACENYNEFTYEDCGSKFVDGSTISKEQTPKDDLKSSEGNISNGSVFMGYGETNLNHSRVSKAGHEKKCDIKNCGLHISPSTRGSFSEMNNAILQKYSDVFKVTQEQRKDFHNQYFCPTQNVATNVCKDGADKDSRAHVEFINNLISKYNCVQLSSMLKSLKERSLQRIVDLERISERVAERTKSESEKCVYTDAVLSNDFIENAKLSSNATECYPDKSAANGEKSSKETRSSAKQILSRKSSISTKENKSHSKKSSSGKQLKTVHNVSEVSSDESFNAENSYITVSEATTSDTSINDDSYIPIVKDQSSNDSVYENILDASKVLKSETSSEDSSSDTSSSKNSSNICQKQHIHNSDMCLSGSCMTDSRDFSRNSPTESSDASSSCSYQRQNSDSSLRDWTCSLLRDFSNVSIKSDFSPLSHKDLSYASFKEGVSSASLNASLESLEGRKSDLLVDLKVPSNPNNKHVISESSLSVEIHKSLISSPYPHLNKYLDKRSTNPKQKLAASPKFKSHVDLLTTTFCNNAEDKTDIVLMECCSDAQRPAINIETLHNDLLLHEKGSNSEQDASNLSLLGVDTTSNAQDPSFLKTEQNLLSFSPEIKSQVDLPKSMHNNEYSIGMCSTGTDSDMQQCAISVGTSPNLSRHATYLLDMSNSCPEQLSITPVSRDACDIKQKAELLSTFQDIKLRIDSSESTHSDSKNAPAISMYEICPSEQLSLVNIDNVLGDLSKVVTDANSFQGTTKVCVQGPVRAETSQNNSINKSTASIAS